MAVGVELKGICKSFKKNLALNQISINFTGGKLHGLIGSEGAGKTTLIRVIMALLNYDDGTLIWTEDQKTKNFLEIRDKISYMPGSQSLYPDLSVEEHLNFFKELYSLSAEEFAQQKDQLLKITRLDKFTSRRSRELSGGMYKKLGLMCALLQRPKILLLDEPTNGVDPISRREFWDLLYELSASEITIIISTAYMDEAERCHIAHLLDAGKHLASGEPRKLLADAGVKTFDEFYLKQGNK
ncbi:MAG: ABC transporter ATP-binding protein [Pseudomonadota bacterium]